MASAIEILATFRDNATKDLRLFGDTLERVTKVGLEPLARISPTAAHAVEGLLGKVGPVGLALAGLAGGAALAVGGLVTLGKGMGEQIERLDNLSTVTGLSV